MAADIVSQSASLDQPDYWWYTARARLLRAALGGHVGTPSRSLDVGSADGPSVGWLPAGVSLDVDPSGLTPGDVCGSATALPFADGVFDLVTAFDVLEHCDPEATALAELRRVLSSEGSLLVSVPAYEWAWTDFDAKAGHHRRYTRRRLRTALERAGFRVEVCTYIFSATFPAFAVERTLRRLRGMGPDRLPDVSPWVETLLRSMCRLDERRHRRGGLPFGSSVVAAARTTRQTG
jgi:SAM-dependent methyltransferase